MRLCHFSCSLPAFAGQLQLFEAVEPHMGTLVRIQIYAAGETQAKAAFRAAFDRIAELDGILSDYRPDSELNRLPRQPGPRPVPRPRSRAATRRRLRRRVRRHHRRRHPALARGAQGTPPSRSRGAPRRPPALRLSQIASRPSHPHAHHRRPRRCGWMSGDRERICGR